MNKKNETKDQKSRKQFYQFNTNLKKLNQDTILSLHRIIVQEHDKKIGLLKSEIADKDRPEKATHLM